MIFDNDFGFINFVRQVPSYMQLASKRVGCFYCFNGLDGLGYFNGLGGL